MYFTKKQFQRPLYKKILPLKKNVLNNDKILKFNKLKWQRFQRFSFKRNRKKFYNPTSYFLSNFKNFFSKKFKYNLQNKLRLSFYYGKLRKNYLKRVVGVALKKSKKQNMQAAILFVQKLEARLDTALYKAHFCYNYYSAGQFITHEKIYVNNKIVKHKFFELKKGDLITLDSSIKEIVKSNISNSDLWPIPPKHFYINYKTLQILVIDNIEYTNHFSYHHFWIDFNSFIRYYTK